MQGADHGSIRAPFPAASLSPMTRRSIDPLLATDPAWAGYVLERFDAFLPDHANCERKASALAMSLVARYPDRHESVPTLIALAREELRHFEEVYALMRARGLRLVRDESDPYVNALLPLMRHGRDERFLDRLLVSSVIECRGAERFGLLAGALRDPELRAFYARLWQAERKHGHQFVDLALRHFDAESVYRRLHELMEQEAGIVSRLAWRAALH